MLPPEQDTDQAGPPGGVLAAERDGLVIQLLGSVGAGAGAVVVSRSQHGCRLLPPAAQQLADGARRQAEGLGDEGGRLATAVAAQDGLAHGQWNRCWHGKSSRGKGR